MKGCKISRYGSFKKERRTEKKKERRKEGRKKKENRKKDKLIYLIYLIFTLKQFRYVRDLITAAAYVTCPKCEVTGTWAKGLVKLVWNS